MPDDPKGQKDGAQTAISERTAEVEKETPKHTEAEAQKMVNDALAKAGRDAKSLKEQGEVLKAQQETIKADETAALERQKVRDAAVEAAIDPEDKDGLAAHLARIKTRDDAADKERLTRERDDARDESKALKEGQSGTARENAVTKFAGQYSVDPEVLLKLSPVGTTLEAIEELAQALPKVAEKKTLKVDSSRNAGPGDNPSTGKEKMREGWDKLHP